MFNVCHASASPDHYQVNVNVWHYRWTTVHARLCTHPPLITWYAGKIKRGKHQHKFHNECNTNTVKHKMYTNNWPAWTRWTAGTSVQASPWVRKMITDHEHWSVSPRIRSRITGITSNKNRNSNHGELKYDQMKLHRHRVMITQTQSNDHTSLEAFMATEFNEIFPGSRNRMWRFSDILGTKSVPIFRVWRWGRS